ncbi:MAG: glycine cleavage system protein H [Candidatus Hodarchaeales archaeon]
MEQKQLKISTKKFDKNTGKEVLTTYFFPLDRYYYANDPGHIWFKEKNSLFEVGFDFFGQHQAGPIHHLRTRPVGKEYLQGRAFGTVESDKWMGQLRLPLTSIIEEVNDKVLSNPALINQDCYNAWVVRIRPTRFDEEIKSKDIIKVGDLEALKQYIISDLEKYDEPPL